MTCLDTTFLIDWLRGTERARRKYHELRNSARHGFEQLSVSIITLYELEKGARQSKKPEADLKLVRDLLSEVVILELGAPAGQLAAELYSDLKNKGRMVGEFDLLIAATCITAGQALLTDDGDFDSISNFTKIHY